jgi:HlyD family secretion protein
VGIAGERYFEVLDGLMQGDQVITGPFASVRELADGAQVKITQPPRSNGVVAPPATGNATQRRR